MGECVSMFCEESEVDAADIIFKMAEVYEKCSSYQDRGIVRHFEDLAAGEVYRHRVAFKTIYRKAQDSKIDYLFEWAEPPVGDPATAKHRVSAFWMEEGKVRRLFYSQSGADPVSSTMPSLDHAIMAAAGISKGASVTVPAYLLASLKQNLRTLFRFKQLVREDVASDSGAASSKGGELIDGRHCFKLRGTVWSGGEEELWIDDEHFLLRRVRVTIVIKPGVDEAQFADIQKIDPQQAEEYRKFRLAQTEERRLYSQIEYFEAEVDNLRNSAGDASFRFDPQVESDLVPSFSVL